ncbi:transcriptional regulator, XRE family [Dethiosulfovibrio peptidovorans DSM 11002]|uniref:Transcriptional regulator, XRE family n=1 Tax=Dethiosulfovibrio peptidovorans DSM 11002 TaxID=469381 RepID=D2Z494_9BACT|nr:helix-turn-helix transcriptional regulator [Dethiosulfovibrio peptidovorans]EFC90423.1 transcriptional regulator, XRE family [Dethiosulfovibrio peptidovorans DSM 11002]
MPFTYKPLLKLLIDRGMTRTELRDAIGTSPNVIAKIGKDEYISLAVLDRICTVLDCTIEAVIRHEKPGKE